MSLLHKFWRKPRIVDPFGGMILPMIFLRTVTGVSFGQLLPFKPPDSTSSGAFESVPSIVGPKPIPAIRSSLAFTPLLASTGMTFRIPLMLVSLTTYKTSGAPCAHLGQILTKEGLAHHSQVLTVSLHQSRSTDRG